MYIIMYNTALCDYIYELHLYVCVCIYVCDYIKCPPDIAFSIAILTFHTCTLSQLQHDSKTAENFKSASVDNSDGVAAVSPEPFKMFIHELN